MVAYELSDFSSINVRPTDSIFCRGTGMFNNLEISFFKFNTVVSSGTCKRDHWQKQIRMSRVSILRWSMRNCERKKCIPQLHIHRPSALLSRDAYLQFRSVGVPWDSNGGFWLWIENNSTILLFTRWNFGNNSIFRLILIIFVWIQARVFAADKNRNTRLHWRLICQRMTMRWFAAKILFPVHLRIRRMTFDTGIVRSVSIANTHVVHKKQSVWNFRRNHFMRFHRSPMLFDWYALWFITIKLLLKRQLLSIGFSFMHSANGFGCRQLKFIRFGYDWTLIQLVFRYEHDQYREQFCEFITKR